MKAMKKVILKLTLVAAFVVSAGYSLYTSQVNEDLSDLALANIEALARGENETHGTLYGNPSGTRFCCCSGSTRTCSAAKCKDC